MYVEYSSNNSGGDWWLEDKHWKDLERAGWKVEWCSLEPAYTKEGDYVREVDGTPKLVPVKNTRDSMARRDKNGQFRWLGAMAKRAYRVGLGLREAADEWERVTGMSATDAGCPCCGQPHNFTEYTDNGEYVASGPDVSYEARW